MKCRNLTLGFVSLALLTGAGAWAFAQPGNQPTAPAKAPAKAGEESDEEVIDLAKAPEAVRTAALKLAGSEKAITKVTKEEEDGTFTYEVEYTADGVENSAEFSPAGDLMKTERGTTEAKLPAAALAALKKSYPNATFAHPVIVTKTFYEVEVKTDGEKHEVKVNASGELERRHHEGKDGEKDKGEKHDGK
jgi:uncharacterized membrane protein YkoI